MLIHTTHASLLARLADDEDQAAWQEFLERYGELIRSFARRQSLQAVDCDDIVQDVLMSLTKSMPGFTYDPSRGKFRSYLKTAVLHAIYRRSRQNKGEVALGPAEAAEAAADDPSVDQQWEQQWRQYHMRQAMKTIEAEFNEADRLAFQHYAIEGREARDTGELLGLTVDQVYQAKSRITRRLSEVVAQQVAEEG